jgi:hypothetical protein
MGEKFQEAFHASLTVQFGNPDVYCPGGTSFRPCYEDRILCILPNPAIFDAETNSSGLFKNSFVAVNGRTSVRGSRHHLAL